jgi:FAD/FMN-containing dehydrogenase
VVQQVITTSGLIYQVNTLGGKINSPEFENSSAYAHRHLPFLSELQAYWDKPERETALVEKFEEIQTIFRKNGITAQYINYPDLKFENWPEAYYGKNYAKLQEIKQLYDPNNSIRHEQSVKA